MRTLQVNVERSNGWWVAQAVEEPAIITQGRTLDELVFMLEDAAELILGRSDIRFDLLLPPKAIATAEAPR